MLQQKMINYCLSINVLKIAFDVFQQFSAYVFHMFACLHPNGTLEHHCEVYAGFNSQMVVGVKQFKPLTYPVWLGMNIRRSQHSYLFFDILMWKSRGFIVPWVPWLNARSPQCVQGLPQWAIKARSDPLAFLPTLEALIEISAWMLH